jgi:hypothetical protein
MGEVEGAAEEGGVASGGESLLPLKRMMWYYFTILLTMPSAHRQAQ